MCTEVVSVVAREHEHRRLVLAGRLERFHQGGNQVVDREHRTHHSPVAVPELRERVGADGWDSEAQPLRLVAHVRLVEVRAGGERSSVNGSLAWRRAGGIQSCGAWGATRRKNGCSSSASVTFRNDMDRAARTSV